MTGLSSLHPLAVKELATLIFCFLFLACACLISSFVSPHCCCRWLTGSSTVQKGGRPLCCTATRYLRVKVHLDDVTDQSSPTNNASDSQLSWRQVTHLTALSYQIGHEGCRSACGGPWRLRWHYDSTASHVIWRILVLEWYWWRIC